MKRKMFWKEKIAMGIVAIVLILLCIMTLYPFLYILAYSLSDSTVSARSMITIFPKSPTLDNYRAIFKDDSIVRAFLVTVGRTVVGTFLHLIVTGLAAYALSRRELVGKRGFVLFFMVPMYITGGLIPTYIIINKLHLINNFLVYVLPGMFSTFNMLIMKTYFQELPESIEESARMDGAGDLTIFSQFIIPLSMPVFVTITLFVGVGQWNSWFDAMLYMTDTDLHPLQALLYSILTESEVKSYTQVMQMASGSRTNITSEAIKMTVMMVSSIPVICVYPFLQKHFEKGVMLGAVKE